MTKLIRFVLNGEALCLANVVLGLIGDNIAESREPMLHQLAGDLAGINVRYDMLIPPALNQAFDTVFETASAERHGLNITLPYKERVVAKLQINDPLVRAIGAVNTTDTGEKLSFGCPVAVTHMPMVIS